MINTTIGPVMLSQLNMAPQDKKYRPDVMITASAGVIRSPKTCYELAEYFRKAGEELERWENLDEGK